MILPEYRGSERSEPKEHNPPQEKLSYKRLGFSPLWGADMAKV